MNKYIKIIKHDIIDGEKLDTEIELTGIFTVAGTNFEDFANELAELILKYKI